MLYPKEEGDYEVWESLAPTLMPILKEELGEIFLPWTSAVTESMQKQEKCNPMVAACSQVAS